MFDNVCKRRHNEGYKKLNFITPVALVKMVCPLFFISLYCFCILPSDRQLVYVLSLIQRHGQAWKQDTVKPRYNTPANRVFKFWSQEVFI